MARTRTIFALDVKVGDTVLKIQGEDTRVGEAGRFPRVEYIGDWCEGPDGRFGARIGFTDRTHTDANPTDVFEVRRR